MSQHRPPRRVFLSYSSELDLYPHGDTFVAAARRAITNAGDVCIEMATQPASAYPRSRVRDDVIAGCAIYVGLVGFRYEDQGSGSDIEAEFEVATIRRMPRLMYLIRDTAMINVPRDFWVGPGSEHQAAFRRRIERAALTPAPVGSPSDLENNLYRALREVEPASGTVDQGVGAQSRRAPAMDPRPTHASAGGDGAPPAAPNAPARAGYPGTRWLRRVTTHQWTALGALATVGALLVSLSQLFPTPTSAVPAASITKPSGGDRVASCTVVTGTSENIPTGRTLVTIKHKPGGEHYIEVPTGWESPDTLLTWSDTQYFNNATGESFTISVYLVGIDAVRAARDDPRFDKSWHLTVIPKDWVLLDQVGVLVDQASSPDC